MSEFDDIKDVMGWRDKLAGLIREAEQAATKKDDEARFSVADRLTQFIENSRPQTREIDEMDTLAEATVSSLMKQTVREQLEQLKQRGAELARLTKGLSAQADATLASAESIGLTKTREVVKILTDSVDALKEFRAALDTDDPSGILTNVQDLLVRIQEVRNAIESRPAPRSASPRAFTPAAASPRAQKARTRKREKRK